MRWEEKDQEDGESLYDVLPSKSIVADDPLAVVEEQTVSAFFKKKAYAAVVVGRGMSCVCLSLFLWAVTDKK